MAVLRLHSEEQSDTEHLANCQCPSQIQQQREHQASSLQAPVRFRMKIRAVLRPSLALALRAAADRLGAWRLPLRPSRARRS
jgi:hypothetical protein